MQHYKVEIDERELATILAALRYWQDRGGFEGCRNEYISDIATDCCNLEPMYEEEIDALCERINCAPDAVA